jgi:drug/metabolite transporter (DMT)-like permease
LATLGVLLVIDPASARLDADLWRGNLILVGAALTWALYSVLVRRSAGGVGALPFTFVALLGGLPLALALGAWELARVGVGDLTLSIWLGVLYLGLVSTAMAAYWWNYAFEHLEAGLASLTFFAQPLVGAALGALLLGERFTPLFLMGAALILVGLWLAARRR